MQLRLAMNGIVSTSMRNQGILYKLNFGVSLPKIKEISLSYTPNASLAATLWKEDVREMKILATLLHPLEEFTEALAIQWASEVQHQEIAEQLTLNLLMKKPFVLSLAAQLLNTSKEFQRVIGFLAYAHGAQQEALATASEEQLLREAHYEMEKGVSRLSSSARIALKRFGRRSLKTAKNILDHFESYNQSDDPVKKEFYEDLHFEFEFYHHGIYPNFPLS